MAEKIIQLKPLKEKVEYYDAIEAYLREYFKKEIYLPLLKIIDEPKTVLKNSKESDIDEFHFALQSGKITFFRGTFSGKFSAASTRALKSLGARWDRKSDTFKASLSILPPQTKIAISSSEIKFQEKLKNIDKTLEATVSKIMSNDPTEHAKLSSIFDKTLFRVEKDFQKSVENIIITPKLTPEMRKKIVDDWRNNMDLYIKDFTKENIKKLRKEMQKSILAGNRYGSVVSTIEKNYGISANKAKFLARQETSLMMSKFKEARYADAGVKEYTWHHAAGSPKHPVRKRHKFLGEEKGKDGKPVIRRFDKPPITSEANEPTRRNNPGEDYNCRCFARPVVRF